jgi:phospholipase C
MASVRNRAIKRLLGVAALAVVSTVCVTAFSGSARATTTASTTIPSFKHVVVVVFENHGYSDIVGNPAAPTFNALAAGYAQMTNYYGVAHPSLPNYLAIVSGSTHGITNDCTKCIVTAKNLADSLEAAHKTWKTYAENLPYAGATGATYGGANGYAKKHDPFMYFKDIQSSKTRRAHIVPYTKLAKDVSNNALPSFSLIIPNLCDDMHNCDVSTGDTWLQNNIVPLVNSPALGTNGVLFVVFDEAEGGDKTGGGGHIDALALGPAVTSASTFAATTNHYGLLRTIEDAWHLPRLAKSATAKPITGIWK